MLINKVDTRVSKFVFGSLKASIDPPKLKATIVVPTLKATVKLND